MDFGDEDHGASHKMQYEGSRAIPALEEEEGIGQDDDYEDLYDGVNVGESFSLYHQSEVPASSNMVNGGQEAQTYNTSEIRRDVGMSQNAVKPPETGSSNHIGGGPATDNGVHNGVSGNMGIQISMGQTNSVSVSNISKANNPIGGAQEIANNQMVGNSNANMLHANVNDHIIRPQMDNGPTMLFVGELHWWTTDVDLENVLSQYGKVKEIKFFDERASGKSKGYCQVEFYDGIAASSCKEGMNGYMFNGRACVVTFASPQSLKQMGASYANKNPQDSQPLNQGRRNLTEEVGRGGRANYSAGDGGRGSARGGWRPRGRGGFMGPRHSVDNAGGMGGGAMGNFSQGLGGPGFGGPGGGMVHPQGMMGPGFHPTYMGRGGGYGGFSGPGFPGMMPPFPAVNQMGFNGLAPHVNPAFYNRGMAPNGMGMMGGAGMESHQGGMWADPGPGMGGWAGPSGEEHGQRTMESSYGGGEDGDASDYGYKEEIPEKGARTNAAPRETEKVSERERERERGYSGTSERKYRDDREQDWDRSDREHKYREEKDNSYKDHRHKKRDSAYEDDWDRGQSSSRSRSRSRAVVEDDHRFRSRNADYGKRRRGPSE